MNCMINQLKAAGVGLSGKPLDDAAIRRIGDYLTGQLHSLDEVGTLAPLGHLRQYGVAGFTAEIAANCKGHPELLPRLRRYLFMLNSISDRFYTGVVTDLRNMGIPLADIFLNSGFHVSWLLDFLFPANPRHYYRETPELLALAYQKDPKAVHEFIDEAEWFRRLPLLAYCAHSGTLSSKPGLLAALFQKGGTTALDKLEEDILTGFSALMRSRRDKAAAVYGVALARELPRLTAFYNQTLRQSELKQFPLIYRAAFFVSVIWAAGSLPDLKGLLTAACETDTAYVVDSLFSAMLALDPRPSRFAQETKLDQEPIEFFREIPSLPLDNPLWDSTIEPFQNLRQLFDRIGLSQAYLSSYLAGRMIMKREPWHTLWIRLCGDIELTRKAAAVGQPLPRVMLRLLLAEQGQPLPLAECEALCMDDFRERAAIQANTTEVKLAADYLTQKTDLPPENLPILNPYHNPARNEYVQNRLFECTLFQLPEDSALWKRYFIYMATHGSRIDLMLLSLTEARGWDGAKIARTALDLEVGLPLLRAVPPHGESAVGKQILQTLACANPEWVASIVTDADTSAEDKLTLLAELYEVCPLYDPALLITCLGDKSKKVRDFAATCLASRKDAAPQVEKLLTARKKDVRAAAERLMAAYGQGGGTEEETGTGQEGLVAYCARHLPGSAMNSIRWAVPGDLPLLHWKDSGAEAEKPVVMYYLYTILTAKDFILPPKIYELREALCQDNLNAMSASIYAQWMQEGAPAKQKTAVLLYGLHARNSDVADLTKQITLWAENSRGALASDTARAMAFGGSDLALMTVDSFSRKFKNKQVRKAAKEAFSRAAEVLGVSPEVLGDRIIPTLGFDQRGEKTIDYGTRQFTAVLTPALTVQVRDANGKKLSALPKPGAKDDLTLAEAAKADFAALKKSLKAVVSAQMVRLEQALATGRSWSKEAWTTLFVGNPIMHMFAAGLVWGLYEDDTLKESFRYMDDGTLTTAEEEDFDLSAVESGQIGLVHPLDLDEGLRARWQQQLEDYEVNQPLPQINRSIALPTEAERGLRVLERFAGKRLPGITLSTKLQKADWYKGPILDAGCFQLYYREVGSIGVQLCFSGMYVSPEPDDMITVGQVGFYHVGTVSRAAYSYDELKESQLLPLGDVPARLFSEVILDLTLATKTAVETDPQWQSEYSTLFGRN